MTDYTDESAWPKPWDDYDGQDFNLSNIIGKIPTKIAQSQEQITMWFSDGYVCRFYHEQGCCEAVYVEDVNGDWNDLIGNIIVVADERSERGNEDYGTYTWTFYTFRGVKGSVDVRWSGSSNGYYSESVDFQMVRAKE